MQEKTFSKFSRVEKILREVVTHLGELNLEDITSFSVDDESVSRIKKVSDFYSFYSECKDWSSLILDFITKI